MRLRRRFITLALVAIGGVMAASPSAFGAQSTSASCVGAGSSALAPGQQDVWPPGTRAEIAHFGKTVADQMGVSPGSLVVTFAQQKGSAAECFPNGPPLP
jgi:hypothetical protein